MQIEEWIKYLTLGYRSTFLIGLSSVGVAKWLLPKFLQYGKTLVADDPPGIQQESLAKRVVYYTVPKACFSHFYILSTTLSLITLCEYYKYPIVWLILLHSLRRLYETKVVCQYTSESRMHWSHYIVGLWFYTTLNVMLYLKLYQQAVPYSLKALPSVVFFLASWDQYKNHKTLSKLVKYSLPTQRLFQIVCCPHYLDEILIYTSLVPYNFEFSWLLVWVSVNLGVSAVESRKYYIKKFPTSRVPRYAVIPYIV